MGDDAIQKNSNFVTFEKIVNFTFNVYQIFKIKLENLKYVMKKIINFLEFFKGFFQENKFKFYAVLHLLF